MFENKFDFFLNFLKSLMILMLKILNPTNYFKPTYSEKSKYVTIKKLGDGSRGNVKLVRERKTGKIFALKEFQSKHLDYYEDEIYIIQKLNHPMIIKSYGSFKHDTSNYIILEACKNDLYSFIESGNKLSESTIKFYTACIVLGIEHIHKMGIIHRDIKLENILISNDGYTKITDFDMAICSLIATENAGTIGYKAPEMITEKDYNQAVDWWALGILIYELSTGKNPFGADDDDEDIIDERIIHGDYEFPQNISTSMRDVIDILLDPCPKSRADAKTLRTHSWFSDIDWNKLEKKENKTPLPIFI